MGDRHTTAVPFHWSLAKGLVPRCSTSSQRMRMSSRKSWGLATAGIALLVSLDTPSLSQKFCQVLAVLTVNPIDECFSGCRQVQLVALAEPTAAAAHRQLSRLLAPEMQAPDAPT